MLNQLTITFLVLKILGFSGRRLVKKFGLSQ